MANNYIFTLGAFVLVYAMSYMIQSPRPEKAVLYLVRRFFRSAGFLVASTSGERSGRRGWFSRWRIAWHRRELNGLPDKIQAWSKAIDYWAFPSTAPDRVDALVVRMRAVAYRIDELLESRAPMSPRSFALVLADEIRAWRIRLESTLADWSSNPDSPAAEALGDHLLEWRAELEARIESLGAGDRELSLGDDELRRFYALLGGYRGVSGTLLAYGDEARQIDWAAWREERFS